MALVTKTKPGMFGGVSKQNDSLRKDNQVSEMINCIPSLVMGTMRRAKAEDCNLTINSEASFIYDYSRSSTESHIITVTKDGVINAYTIDDGEKDVTVEDGVSDYLTHNDSNSLSGITLGDTTFIVNSEVKVTTEEVNTKEIIELADVYKSDPGVVEVHAKETAYYWLSKSSNDPDNPYNYSVKLDGVTYEYSNELSTDAAKRLANKIKYKSVTTTLTATSDDNDDSHLTITTDSGYGYEVEHYDSNDDISIDTTNNDDKTQWEVYIKRADDEFDYYTLVIGDNYYSTTGNTIKEVRDNFVNKINGKSCKLVTTTRNDNGFNSESDGSLIRIWKDDFSNFEFEYWDSYGSLASFGWKYDVSKVQDLPASFPWDGAVVRVNGDSSKTDSSSSYYLIRWGDTWQEFTSRTTYKYNEDEDKYERYLPMLVNMPIVIKRNSDGNFDATLLKSSDGLKPPLVGNEDNNKDPSFVDNYIKQLFFVNGRICIISNDNIIFSEVNVYWNFYLTTVIDILDGDSIDVSISSEKVITILSVTIFQSGLLIMTTEGQYLLNTENGITPSSIAINKLSDYAYSDDGGTLYDGDSIVFSGITGNTARIYRYRVARLTSENKAIDLTIQVPTYIEGTVQQIVNYVEDGTIIIRVNDKKMLYIYNEIISGDQMVQSSWHKWDFSNFLENNILHIFVINNYLYFVTIDGVYKIKLGMFKYNADYSHKDLDEYDFDSTIELSLFRPKKGQTQIETPLGRVQLRAYTFSMEGDAILELYRTDTGFKKELIIRPNKQVNVLSDADKSILTIRNKNEKPFVFNGYAITATYRQKGRDTI